MKFLEDIRGTANAAANAASRTALALTKLSRRLDVIEERLKALEDAINDGESQKLKEEKDYIDGMYNLLNYNVGMARKPKGRELNE